MALASFGQYLETDLHGELLKNIMRLSENFAHHAPAMGLIE